MIRHVYKRYDDGLANNTVREARHQTSLVRLNPLLCRSLDAISRTERRLGLSHKPKGSEVSRIAVREL